MQREWREGCGMSHEKMGRHRRTRRGTDTRGVPGGTHRRRSGGGCMVPGIPGLDWRDNTTGEPGIKPARVAKRRWLIR